MKNDIIRTDTIWYKIKYFFNKLFLNNNDLNINEKENRITERSFKEEIKVYDAEKERLLSLQEKFRNKEINEENISKEDLDSISKLYDEQIQQLTQEIDNNKVLLEKLKNEISDDENED